MNSLDKKEAFKVTELFNFHQQQMQQRRHSEEEKDGEEDHLHYHGVDKAEEHISVENALEMFLKAISPVKSELVVVRESLGRVCAKDARSKFDIPTYDRSTRDGFALKVTSGNSIPTESEFRIIGEIRIGKRPSKPIHEGEAVRVATGSFVPIGSDAVLMKEYSEVRSNGSILMIRKEVRKSENILRRGEDIQRGSTVLLRGTRIQPHQISLLAMVGVKQIRVFRKPRVAFFSTGDELVDISSNPRKKVDSNEKTRDINRPYIESMTNAIGAVSIDLGIARDDFQSIRKKIIKGLSYDALMLSAGSSVGERDFASKAAESIRDLKTLAHGVAMRPSSPTALAIYRGKPFIMLPGFPTSMIVSFLVFARPAILKLAGSCSIFPPKIKARLDDEFEGREGVTNFLRVRVEERGGEYYAKIVKPLESQFSSWLKDANGIGVVNQTETSLQKGDVLECFLIGEISQSDRGESKSSL